QGPHDQPPGPFPPVGAFPFPARFRRATDHSRVADGASPCRRSVQSGNAHLWHSPEALSCGGMATIPVITPPSSARLCQCNWIGNPHVLRQLNVNRWSSESSTLSSTVQSCLSTEPVR